MDIGQRRMCHRGSSGFPEASLLYGGTANESDSRKPASSSLKSHSCPGVTPLRRENLGRSPAVTSDREPGCAGRCRVLGGALLIGCA